MNELNAESRNTDSRRHLEGPMRWVVPASIALLLVGCNVDEQLDSSLQSVVTHNRLAANKLAGNKLAGNRLSSNRLASNQLSSNRFNLSGTDLIETEDGR